MSSRSSKRTQPAEACFGRDQVRLLLANEAGATLAEYSLLTSLIAVVVISIVGKFGTQLATMYGTFAKALSSA
jgi:Flp pilus assembly pilin Flp